MLKTNLNFKPMENIAFMNNVRNMASTTYQERVPEATKANIHKTIANLVDYEPTYNEFVDVLVNKIAHTVVRNQIWNNVFTEFKKGLIEHGDVIEEIQIDLIDAYTYDGNRDTSEKELLGRNVPDVQVNYHMRNRQDVYKLTINDDELMRAFTTTNGLSNFTAALVSKLATSDQVDEFLIMKQLIVEYEAKNGFFTRKVSDVSTKTSGADEAKELLRTIRADGDLLKFPSKLYNAAGMTSWAEGKDMILVTTPQVKAALDVEALAAAFNIPKMDIDNRIVLVDSLPIAGFQALLTTTDFWQCWDNLIKSTTFINPAGLYRQMWLHHWGTYSTSRFVPAIMYSSVKESTVVSVDTMPSAMSDITIFDREGVVIDAAEGDPITRGDFYGVSVEVTTTPAGGDNTGVEYSISGNENGKSFVTNNGDLHVHISDPTSEITVTATTIAIDPTDSTGTVPLTKSVTVGVTGDVLNPWPAL